jgi:DNA-binding transcriptional MocR family regulator
MPEPALLYERLADDLSTLIDKGALRPGDRMPSVRQLSRQRHVSASTVVQAYLVLENRGVVEARPQSGHYVRAKRAMELPEPRIAKPLAQPSRVGISELVSRVYGAVRDPHIVALGAAYPHPDVLPTDKLNRMLGAIAREAGGAGVSYDPPPGYPPLRRSISRRAVDWGSAIAPEEIVTTVGCMEALHVCLRAVTRPGDTVAVESPTFYGTLQLLEGLGLKVWEIPAHPRTGIDLELLPGALSGGQIAAALVTPNFNNPLGTEMPDEAKQKLVGLCERYEVPLIEDDVYGDLFFGATRPRSAHSFGKTGLTMLCSSFSKTLAPGYRVGWVVPGRFRDEVERLKFTQTIATPTLPQMAIADFLDNGGYDHHLRALRKKLAAQVERMQHAVADHFPPGTRVSRPAGGFVLWVELPPGTSALELCARALERDVSIAPGPIFSARQRFSNCIRLSCGAPWSETIERAVRTLGRLAVS